MLEIASAFSNIELMCPVIHHVPKYNVMEGFLESNSLGLLLVMFFSFFPAQAHQAGGHVSVRAGGCVCV